MAVPMMLANDLPQAISPLTPQNFQRGSRLDKSSMKATEKGFGGVLVPGHRRHLPNVQVNLVLLAAACKSQLRKG